jgi:hypothetical protein
MLKQIAEECNKLEVYQQRCITDKCVDIAFDNAAVKKLMGILTSHFGPATKPAGTNPTEDDLRITESYGSIHSEQTLFKKELDDFIIIAMLWPWQDDAHTTLKIFLVTK